MKYFENDNVSNFILDQHELPQICGRPLVVGIL